jgi:small-conductance mechanosensitive channel
LSALRSKRETFWERIWASTIVLYTFAATFVVWKTMGKYGVNPIGFFVVDLITSWFYGLSTARLVVAIFKKRRSAVNKWALWSGVNFAIPDIYIIAFARHVPRDTYYAFAGVIAVLAAFSIFGVVQQVRAGASEGQTHEE